MQNKKVIYSHENKLLIRHLENVNNIGIKIFEENFFSSLNENSILLNNKKYIRVLLHNVLFYHDIGKASDFFQMYLMANIEKKEIDFNLKLKNHSLISALITAVNTYNALQKIIEIKKTVIPFLYSLTGYIAVKKHHGQLHDFSGMAKIDINWDILLKQYKSLYINKNYIDQQKKSLKIIIPEFLNLQKFYNNRILPLTKIATYEKYVKYFNENKIFLLIQYIFSILCYSDKSDVIFNKKNYSKFMEFNKFPIELFDIIKRYKKKYFTNNTGINKLRNEASKNANQNNLLKKYKIFNINLPTGFGKTLTSLEVALNIIHNNDSLKRIIYVLPFTSILDQLWEIIEAIFKLSNLDISKYAILHHHLAEVKYRMNEELLSGDKAEFMMENWEKPLIFSTFYQLFNSIFSGNNARLRKYHNIANSVIILDEIQSIPFIYWKSLREVLNNMTKFFNCRIIYLSATIPMLDISGESLITASQRSKFFSYYNRYIIYFIEEKLKISELVYRIIQDIQNNDNKTFLIILNTINSAKLVYKQLKDKFENSKKQIFYLSSQILPVFRKQIIKKIIKSKIPKIIVSTQLIEAGVDIDVDIVYRDIAPLDSIFQSAGRCNRNNTKDIGRVNVFILTDDNGKHFSNYIYTPLVLEPSLSVLRDNKVINETEIIQILDDYYKYIEISLSSDEYHNIRKDIEFLLFEKIEQDFVLIRYIPNCLIFVEIDKKATDILDKYKKIISLEQEERANAFYKIKKKFYNYTFSLYINQKNLSGMEDFEKIGNLFVITKNMLNVYYDEKLGYQYKFDNFI